jgi:pyruvate dehydrogenase E1 component beta subunit
LIASVLCKDPVIFIDDRWLYSESDNLPEVVELDLTQQGPRVTRKGHDVTLVGAGYSAKLCEDAAEILKSEGMSAETIDIRVLNPFDATEILKSVQKTGRLVVVDGGWTNSGFASEVIACVTEQIHPNSLKSSPRRVTLTSAPAPASIALEKIYYTSAEEVAATVKTVLK